MACAITSGVSLGCRDNAGGVQKFYIASYSATTYQYNSDGSVSGATGVGTGVTYYTIQQRLEQGSFQFDGTISDANGTVFYTPTAVMTFYKYQASMRDLVYILATGNFRVIVLDQNGKYFLMNETNYVSATAQTVGTGKGLGDLNGSTVTISGKEPAPSREVSSTYFATLTVV